LQREPGYNNALLSSNRVPRCEIQQRHRDGDDEAPLVERENPRDRRIAGPPDTCVGADDPQVAGVHAGCGRDRRGERDIRVRTDLRRALESEEPGGAVPLVLRRDEDQDQ